MFHLIKQVQVATDFAKGACARLAGVPVPSFADEETSFEGCRPASPRRATSSPDCRSTRSTLRRQGDHVEDRRPGDDLPGSVFLLNVATPNFYFHVTSAYAILRSNGVELGKGDFMGRTYAPARRAPPAEAADVLAPDGSEVRCL